MANGNRNPVFEYTTMRLLVGIIALGIAPLVSMISSTTLPSVSASYYTEARDVFVGMLFIVSAFLFAYQGHSTPQAFWSKIASLAAALLAVFPTYCATCDLDWKSITHMVAATVFFGILAYFCIIAFGLRALRKRTRKGWWRSLIYFVCGGLIVLCIIAALIVSWKMSREALDSSRIIYLLEVLGLSAFGIAWIIAGHKLPILADDT